MANEVVSLFRQTRKGWEKRDYPAHVITNPNKAQKVMIGRMKGEGWRELEPGEEVEITDGKNTLKFKGHPRVEKPKTEAVNAPQNQNNPAKPVATTPEVKS